MTPTFRPAQPNLALSQTRSTSPPSLLRIFRVSLRVSVVLRDQSNPSPISIKTDRSRWYGPPSSISSISSRPPLCGKKKMEEKKIMASADDLLNLSPLSMSNFGLLCYAALCSTRSISLLVSRRSFLCIGLVMRR